MIWEPPSKSGAYMTTLKDFPSLILVGGLGYPGRSASKNTTESLSVVPTELSTVTLTRK